MMLIFALPFVAFPSMESFCLQLATINYYSVCAYLSN